MVFKIKCEKVGFEAEFEEVMISESPDASKVWYGLKCWFKNMDDPIPLDVPNLTFRLRIGKTLLLQIRGRIMYLEYLDVIDGMFVYKINIEVADD